MKIRHLGVRHILHVGIAMAPWCTWSTTPHHHHQHHQKTMPCSPFTKPNLLRLSWKISNCTSFELTQTLDLAASASRSRARSDDNFNKKNGQGVKYNYS